jgi:hypothetical protein
MSRHSNLDPQFEYLISEELQNRIAEVQHKFKGRRMSAELLRDVRAEVCRSIARFVREYAPAGFRFESIVAEVGVRPLFPDEVQITLNGRAYGDLVAALCRLN